MKYKLSILTLIISADIWAQTGMNPCNRNISTNPANPYNDEWTSEFSGKTQHFTNTGFTWYPPGFGATITIDKTQNWATPYAAQSGVISMLSPFVDDNQRGTDYLQQGPVELRDWHWEDGWELLWMNLGIYPNGDKIDGATNSSHWLGAGLSWDPTPNNAPFFILYNRYKGVLRVFANIWFKDPGIGTVENVIVKLELDGSQKDENDNHSYSGVFRLVNGLDKALDQPTDVVMQSSPRRHPTPNGYTPQGVAMNTNQWVAADFQIAYDPCQCHVPTKLTVYFETREKLEVDLAIREIAYDKDLNQLNPDEKDYFQSMLDEGGNVIAPGNVAYASINSLIADYKKALEQYNDQLNDYNNPLNLLKIELSDLLESGLNGGYGIFSPLTALSGGLTDYLKKKPLILWGDTADTGDFSKDLAKQVNNFGKKVLADEFDFLNVALGVQAKPVKPQVPQATFTEGRIAGEISKKYVFPSAKLNMPGTVLTSNSDINNFSPYNVPAYNNVMGMYALMKTPELRFYQQPQSILYNNREIRYFESWEEPFQGNYIEVTASYNNRRKFSFILPDGLQYAINQALDWDEEKTSFLVSFQIEFENENLASNSDWQSQEVYLEGLPNFEMLHQITNVHNKLITVLSSEYYDMDDIRNKLFSFTIANVAEIKGFADVENWWNMENNRIEIEETAEAFLIGQTTRLATNIKSIKMKVIADMYFDQIGYFQPDPNDPSWQGEQVNTFQVRTFELYNKDKPGSLEEQLRGEIVEECQSWANYLPGTTVLDGEIADTDPRVKEINSATNTLIIRAENVEVTGEVKPESGYNLRIEAMTDIKVLEGGKFLPNVTATIVPDFYGNGANPPANTAEVSAFCSGTNPVYGANNPGKRAQEIIEANERERLERAKREGLQIQTYPNPASTFVQIAVQNQPQQLAEVGLVLIDLTGRQILQDTQTASAAGRYVLSLPELPTGVYMLHVTAGDKTAVEKIVVR